MTYRQVDSSCMTVRMAVVGGDMIASLVPKTGHMKVSFNVKRKPMSVSLGLVCKVNLKTVVVPLLDKNSTPLLSIRGGLLFARHSY